MLGRRIRMGNIITRKGRTEDARDFSQLVLSTASTLLPYFFGSDVRNVMQRLFEHTRNWFSFEHSYFIEVNGEIAGMALVCNHNEKKRESLRTCLLVLKYLKWSILRRLAYLLKSQHVIRKVIELTYLLRSEHIMVRTTEGECYLRNIALRSKFRGLGFATKLLGVVEEESRKTGSKRIVLDVGTDNKAAIKLYKRFGYSIEQKLPILKIKDKNLEIFRMSKDIRGIRQSARGNRT
jgi:ribosomal protein S18 acetylase RimI-like enzyme